MLARLSASLAPRRALGYRTQRLTSREDIEHFSEGYSAAFKRRGYSVVRPIRNLRPDAQVWGVFRGEELVAGFMLAEHPARCLEGVDEETAGNLLRELGEENVCELTSIWKSPKERGAASSVMLWTEIVRRAMGMDRRYIFGCNRIREVGQRYYYALPPTFVARASQPGELESFYYTRAQFMGTFAVAFGRFVGRLCSAPLRVLRPAPRLLRKA